MEFVPSIEVRSPFFETKITGRGESHKVTLNEALSSWTTM